VWTSCAVVKLCEHREFFFPDGHQSVFVPINAPLVEIIFDSWRETLSRMIKTKVNRFSLDQIRYINYIWCLFWSAKYVYRKCPSVAYGEKFELVLKLAMQLQSKVEFFSQLSSFWVIVYSVRVEESGDTLKVSNSPSAGEEAFVKVGLLAFQ
jgi:hypothetical protein